MLPREAVEKEGEMPKEVIKGIGRNRLDLGWTKGSYAQVGVDLGNPFTFVNHDEGEPETNTGLYFTFNSREDINRAIRALRKMRDDVYGKDA